MDESTVHATDFGFTSQRIERSFGLMDYNARYYNPRIGRFVSPDTIVPEPTSSGGFNRYRYVRGNPLKYTDPSGHAECIDIDCKHRTNPKTGELIGNYQWVRRHTLLGSTEVVSEKPSRNIFGQKPFRSPALDNFASATGALELLISGGGSVVEGAMTFTNAVVGFVASGGRPLVAARAGIQGFAASQDLYRPLDFLGEAVGVMSSGGELFNTIFLNAEMYYDYQNGPGIVVPQEVVDEVFGTMFGVASSAAIPDFMIDYVKHNDKIVDFLNSTGDGMGGVRTASGMTERNANLVVDVTLSLNNDTPTWYGIPLPSFLR